MLNDGPTLRPFSGSPLLQFVQTYQSGSHLAGRALAKDDKAVYIVASVEVGNRRKSISYLQY